MLAAVISTLPLFLIATGVLAAPMDLESRDADGNKLPVVHLSKFDCREYNKGNPKYSLCATDKNRAFPKKNKCTALAKSWADGPNQVQPTEWGTYGYTGDSDCTFEGYNHNDPASARGLVNMTFDTTTMGAWIKEQSEACFFEGSPFNYAHCSISDPMAFFFLFSTDPAPDSA